MILIVFQFKHGGGNSGLLSIAVDDVYALLAD